MLSERIFAIGILIFYILIPTIIFLCFLFIFFGVESDLNAFYTTTISFLIGKYTGLVITKLINFHQQEQFLKLQADINKIASSVSAPSLHNGNVLHQMSEKDSSG